MYRQKKESDICDRLADIDTIILDAESCIDPDTKLVLMTVTPLREYLPDMDFLNQHIYFCPYIHTYIQACACGVACVESTENGTPHYHLWYQQSEDCNSEALRIRWVKVLQRIANVKFETKVRHYKIGKWYPKGNALYYYKKDSVTKQLFTPYNPIVASTVMPIIDYTDYTYFFSVGKLTSRKVIEKVSQVKQLEEFYKKSL